MQKVRPRKSSILSRSADTVPTLIQAPILEEIPWLVHGFSTRRGGVSSIVNDRKRQDLNLGRVSWDSPRNVANNRRLLLEGLRAEGMNLVVLRQIHSTLIRIIDSDAWYSSDASMPLAGDGLITSRGGQLLSILAADCLPILLVDVRQRLIAALHCGWRGTAGRVAEKGVGMMRMMFASRPEDLRAAIGPGIRACCYRVGPEVEEVFEGQFPYWPEVIVHRIEPRSALEKKYPRIFTEIPTTHERLDTPTTYLDLVAANVRQLRKAGLPDRNIWSDAPCTSCNPELFFSHRRDEGRTGRMMGVIGIRDAKP